VTTAQEYRELADECLGWAKTAKTNQERDIFLQMARTWLEAATIAAGIVSSRKSVLQPAKVQRPTEKPSALDAE
jgi:hypothetical protein